MSCHAMPCHAMPYHAIPYHAMPCHAMFSSACLGCEGVKCLQTIRALSVGSLHQAVVRWILPVQTEQPLLMAPHVPSRAASDTQQAAFSHHAVQAPLMLGALLAQVSLSISEACGAHAGCSSGCMPYAV